MFLILNYVSNIFKNLVYYLTFNKNLILFKQYKVKMLTFYINYYKSQVFKNQYIYFYNKSLPSTNLIPLIKDEI